MNVGEFFTNPLMPIGATIVDIINITDNQKSYTMNKEFVPHEQSLILKDMGFNEPCLAFYPMGYAHKLTTADTEEFGWILQEVGVITNTNFDVLGTPIGLTNYVSAPLYQQAFRYFRENHGLTSAIMYIKSEGAVYTIASEEHEWPANVWFDEYEEAELACLNRLIEIVKENHVNNEA